MSPQGDVAEITIYNEPLSNREIKTAHRFLRRKYRMMWYQRFIDWLRGLANGNTDLD